MKVPEAGIGHRGSRQGEGTEAGALSVSGQLGKTVLRLRKSFNLSLSELSEQSGVAKSIISQIERNETNPTLATIWRLAQALDVSIEGMLQVSEDEPFLEKSTRGDTPILVSDDGKCRLEIFGWIKTVEWLQWYGFHAEAGGALASDRISAARSNVCRSRMASLKSKSQGPSNMPRAGETLRYRCDRPHVIRNRTGKPAAAMMVCILKAAAME